MRQAFDSSGSSVLDRNGAIEAHVVSLTTAVEVNGLGRKVLNFKVGGLQIERYRASSDYLGVTFRYDDGQGQAT